MKDIRERVFRAINERAAKNRGEYPTHLRLNADKYWEFVSLLAKDKYLMTFLRTDDRAFEFCGVRIWTRHPAVQKTLLFKKNENSKKLNAFSHHP